MPGTTVHRLKGGVSAAAPIELRNEVIAVQIDPGTGGIVKLTDRRNGQEHMHAPTGRIFRLTGPRERMGGAALDSEFQAGQVVEAGDHRLRLRFEELNAHDYRGAPIQVAVDVEVTYWLEDGPELFTSLTIENRSDQPLHQVQFPLVSGWTGYAGPGEDELTTGAGFSAARVDPHADNISREVDWYTILGAQERWEMPYPIRTLTPWVDLSGGGRGLGVINYLEAPRSGGPMLRDHTGYLKQHIMEVGWYSIVDLRPGTTWTSSRFGIHLHRGDWHDTADRFREWLLTWWKPAIAPEQFRRSLGFQNVLISDFDGLQYRDFSDLPDIVRTGLEYGIEGLSIWEWTMLGFYHRDDERGLHDFSPEELDALKQAIAECVAMGAAVSTLTNTRLVLRTSQWWKDGGEAGAIKNTHGESRYEDWSVVSQEAGYWPRGRGPASSVLCARSKVFRDLADEHLDALTEIGFNAMFLDQPGEYSPCYDTTHGHLEPGDTQEAVAQWAIDYRKRFDPASRGGYILGEYPDLFSAQGIDVFWSWYWKRARTDVVAYTFPELTHTWVVDRNKQDALGGFLHGFQLALTTRGLTGDLRDEPDFAAWLKELSVLRKATAEATTLAQYVDDRGLTVDGPVRAKRYLTEGGTSVVVINDSDEEATAVVSVAAQAATAAVKATGGSSWVDTKAGSDPGLKITLAPWSALVWELTSTGD